MTGILLTRPLDASQKIAQELSQYTIHLAPMLEYRDLVCHFDDVHEYTSFIFTSAYAVDSFARRCQSRHQKVFAVGDVTAAAATTVGFTNVVSAGGNSSDIKNLLVQERNRKCLHLCSDDTPADMADFVTQKLIYKADLANNIPPAALQALIAGEIRLIPFFSARSAANFVKLVLRSKLEDAIINIDALAISEQAALPLKKLQWRKLLIADAPTPTTMLELMKTTMAQDPNTNQLPSVAENRQGADRRQRAAPRDAQGFVIDTTYTGPDRRSGIDRRAYQKRQQEAVMREKVKFLHRSLLTFGVIFFVVVLVGVFIMAPEYMEIQSRAAQQESAPQPTPSNKTSAPVPIGGIVNSQIEKIQQTSGVTTAAVGSIANTVVSTAKTAIITQNPEVFMQLMDRINNFRASPEGQAVLNQSMQMIRGFLSANPHNPNAISAAMNDARNTNPDLQKILSDVGAPDLAAAAMLMTLNEFRSNVNQSRPFKEDLAVLQSFAGSNETMRAALNRLAPYAESGIMSRETLQEELKKVAAEVVSAKIAGQDVSISATANAHFDQLVKTKTAEQMIADKNKTAIAEAQKLLSAGDVAGATKILQGLQGQGATAAAPWLQQATDYMAAGNASDAITQSILQALGGAGGLSPNDLLNTLKSQLPAPKSVLAR